MATKPTHQLIVDGYVFFTGSKKECERTQYQILSSGDPRMARAKTSIKKI